MSSQRPPEEYLNETDIVQLRLPVPERDVIITSRHVADTGLQERIRETPPRVMVSFNLEELEDLHRGLSFDSDQTLDTKRRKTIAKVLRKIEEYLDADEDKDFDEYESWDDGWNDEQSVPQSPQEFFEKVFCGRLGPVAGNLPPCRVKLTSSNRQTLCGMETVSLDIHKLLTVDSPDELEFAMSPRQILMISLAVKEALDQCEDDSSAKPYREIAQRVSDGLFAVMGEAAELDDERRYHDSQANPVKLAFQLKITLEGSKPPIWRRVLVGDCTLDVLHQIVQVAMGWTNSHMHQFEWDGDYFSDPRFEMDMDDDHYDETRVRLSQLVGDGCRKLRYWYDFGDDWWHTIQIEKTLKPEPTDTFPVCVKGVGACPPEDVGGIWGYYDFVDAIRDPKHERHDEFVEWWGQDFDPEAFDIEKTNKALTIGPVAEFDDEDDW